MSFLFLDDYSGEVENACHTLYQIYSGHYVPTSYQKPSFVEDNDKNLDTVYCNLHRYT